MSPTLPTLRTLTCRLEGLPNSPLPPPQAYAYDEVDAFHRELTKKYKLKYERSWLTAPLDDALAPFLQHVQELAAKGIAELAGAHVVERLAYRSDAAWYVIQPTKEFNPRNRKAAGDEVLHSTNCIVSDHFRAAVDRAKLDGIVYLVLYGSPIPGDPRHWFGCSARHHCGRGIDHPWAMPREAQISGETIRVGAWQVNEKNVIVEMLDPTVRGIYDMLTAGTQREHSFAMRSYPRIWSGAWPSSDFCVLPGDGRPMCISHNGATSLLNAGIFTTAMLEPIDSVTSADHEAMPILDLTLGPAMALESRWLKTESVPNPAVAIARNRSKPTAQSAKRKLSKPFLFPPRHPDAETVTEKAINRAADACEIEVPPVWRQVLLGLGIHRLGDMEPHHPKRWLASQPRSEQAFRDANHNLPADLFFIGDTTAGDTYALALDRISRGGDCPLLKFDHGTGQCIHRWPNVIAFLREVL